MTPVRWVVYAGVILYEVAIAWIALWLNRIRYDQGPVVLILTNTHGLHRTDVLLLGEGLLPLILLGVVAVSRWLLPRGEK